MSRKRDQLTAFHVRQLTQLKNPELDKRVKATWGRIQQSPVEKLGFNGLVIGNDDPRTFSVGADLSLVSFAISAGAWDDIAASMKTFQDRVMSIRRAPFPVVVAPAGMTLGGGLQRPVWP